MMTVSRWLTAYVSSHGIYDAVGLQESYETETGKTDKLPTHSREATRDTMDNRGLGGTLGGRPGQSMCWGYEVGAFLAGVYGDPNETLWKTLMGRGSMFRACIDSIEKAGD